jgi:hypothetical protein
MKTMVLLAFLAILTSLGSALFFMLRGDRKPEPHSEDNGRHMARMLAWRVGLSIALFVALLLAWKLGYIQPTGLPAA